MQIMKPPTTVVRKCRLSHHLFTVFALLLFAVFFFGEDLTYIFDVELQLGPTAVRIMGLETKREELPPFAIGKNEEGCDVFSGRWNFDESTRPLYEESECPYIQPQLTFQEHGRPDKVPEMALADPRLRSSQLQRHFDARDTTREEDDVCRRFSKPGSICFHDLPSPLIYPQLC
ncbi:hypothetical protein ACFXTH_001464 [Malus domestica]